MSGREPLRFEEREIIVRELGGVVNLELGSPLTKELVHRDVAP